MRNTLAAKKLIKTIFKKPNIVYCLFQKKSVTTNRMQPDQDIKLYRNDIWEISSD